VASLSKHVVKAIADFAVFLEFSEEKSVDPDIGVQAMEQLANELSLMADSEKAEFTNMLKAIAPEYADKEQSNFVVELPVLLGLV
jgi:hypothetical protein